jgi:hypothetical protein
MGVETSLGPRLSTDVTSAGRLRKEEGVFPYPADLPRNWVADARTRGRSEYDLCLDIARNGRSDSNRWWCASMIIIEGETAVVYKIPIRAGNDPDGFNTSVVEGPSDCFEMYLGFIRYARERLAEGEPVGVEVLTARKTRTKSFVSRLGNIQIGGEELGLLKEQLIGMAEGALLAGDSGRYSYFSQILRTDLSSL